MKKLAMFAVAAAALVLAAGKVEASGNLVLNISGSIQYQVTNSANVGKTKTQSFNNATIYNLISNAVANAANGIATNLPAKGIIAYDPEGYDGTNNGIFYVTDKTNGFYYPLSGFDTNSQYYSFIELDSYVIINNSILKLGFDYPFDGSASYTLNASGNGSLSGKDTALLYIHDNPYVYDTSDFPDNFYGANNTFYGSENNEQALEIQGIMAISLAYKSNSINSGSISLSGAGNALLNGNNYDASVISGHASLK
jgi:hypothetical protein